MSCLPDDTPPPPLPRVPCCLLQAAIGRSLSKTAREVLRASNGYRGGKAVVFLLASQATIESSANFQRRRDSLTDLLGVELYPVAVDTGRDSL